MNRTEYQPDTSGVVLTDNAGTPAPTAIEQASAVNPFLRCAIPPLSTVSPDSLRQFYRTGVPQNRITPVSPISGVELGKVVTSAPIVVSVAPAPAPAPAPAVLSVPVTGQTSSTRETLTLTTATLAAGANETGTLVIAESFELLKVTVNYPARVRLYSSTAARDADIARTNSASPQHGMQHGVITDLYLLTPSMFAWTLAPAAFGDSTSSSIAYTITNLDTVSRQVMVSFTVLPIEE